MAMTARVPINFRMGAGGIEWIDKLILEYAVAGVRLDRSEVIRASLAVATKHRGEVFAQINTNREQM